ncbi:type II and III secretion system protein family protein [Phenylobacterium sp.]|uniref:type II and III secretion system protein family protein n=1 Tax=Phenylobacterium sp. TaxID=1871053 RepID=UPI0028121C5E|nr:type II and III secretion system protein family protein [Phenylobacterium sp.]
MKTLPKTVTAIAAAVSLTFGAAAPQAAHADAAVMGDVPTELKVEAGKGRLIRLDRPAATVFIADPKIADVQVKSPTLVYVLGKAPGATSLFALDGKEQMIANLAVNVAIDTARLSAALKRHAPNSQIEVESVDGALILSGKAGSAAEGADVLRIASQFLPGDGEAKSGRLINRIAVEQTNQVNLRVRVVEVSRDARKLIGVNWNAVGQIGSGAIGLATGRDVLTRLVGADAVAGSYRDGDVDVNVLVDLLSRKGLVKVLAEPNLTAVSGEPASFLAGGEYPIPVAQEDEKITVEYKQFGVSLAFVATVMDGGRISLNVRPEVSQLSEAGAVTINQLTLPALTTRRAETTVELGSGQSFSIAGLLQNTSNDVVRKMPGLGDIPVLGQLFRSKDFQKSESELVIIVTPYLVKPSRQKLATPEDLNSQANARNLAAMVAEPAHLTEGANPAAPAGDAALNAVKRVQAGKVKPLPNTDTTDEGQ